MLAGPEEDGSKRRSDTLPGPVDENLRPGQGNDIERGLARRGDRGRRYRLGFLRLGRGFGRVRFRRLDGGAGLRGGDSVLHPARALGIFCSWRDLWFLGLRRGFRCFILGGLHLGRFPRRRHQVHRLRPAVRVPVAARNHSRPDDQRKRERRSHEQFAVDHPRPGQASQAQLRELGQAQARETQARETQGLLRCRQRDGAPQIAWRGTDRVDLVLAHVFVGLGSLVMEQFPVVLGQARHHVVIGARDEDLPRLGEAHDALRDVDSVADDVGLAVDVLDEPHRPQIDPDANLQAWGTGDVLIGNGVAQAHAREQGIFGIPEKAHGRPVPGVEDDAVVGGDARDRLAQNSVEPFLQRDLLGDRAQRVVDDVEKEHAADECSIGMLRHLSPPQSACPASARVRPASYLGLHSTAAGPGGHRKVARISTHCQPVALPRDGNRVDTMSVTQEQVHSALKEILDPNTGTDFLATKSARNIKVEGGSVSLEIELGYPAKTQLDPIRKLVAGKLRGVPGVSAVNVSVTSKIVSHTVQRGVKLIPGVKNIVAVASGKGGVGKSTTAVNLALALAAEGASVGVLDADIYGPSQPMMLGITGRPESKDGKTLEPMMGHGIQAISIGFLIDIDTPMVWRGPMVTQALEQLLKDTRWKDIDYLIVDMPPGTGDIQLTLAQKVPVTGAVIVTTPQDIALIDARKGLKMFEKVGIPILGIEENMSTHICSQCGHEEHIFGQGGAERMCREYGTELLGSLPLDIAIREQADSGKPTVVADPDGRAAEIYRAIARRLAVKIAESAKDMTSKFPNIVVSKDT